MKPERTAREQFSELARLHARHLRSAGILSRVGSAFMLAAVGLSAGSIICDSSLLLCLSALVALLFVLSEVGHRRHTSFADALYEDLNNITRQIMQSVADDCARDLGEM